MKKRIKVYLSRSNEADSAVVAKVRQNLTTYDCEVLEYRGGFYNNTDLLKADLVIMVTKFLPEGTSVLVITIREKDDKCYQTGNSELTLDYEYTLLDDALLKYAVTKKKKEEKKDIEWVEEKPNRMLLLLVKSKK